MTIEAPSKIFYLYRITNCVNGKIYIGQTIQPDKRWYQHKVSAVKPVMIISHAIKKYGNDAFEFEVIAACKSCEDANHTETFLVQQYDCLVPKGYNVAPGGMNAPKTEEWKQKLRDHWADPEYKEKVSAAISKANLGREHTEQSKQNMSKAKSGSGNPNFGTKRPEETKRKIADSLLGVPHTEERRKNLSLSKIKTTPEQEGEIRVKFMLGRNLKQLAKEYNVSSILIRRVVGLKCSKDYRNKISA